MLPPIMKGFTDIIAMVLLFSRIECYMIDKSYGCLKTDVLLNRSTMIYPEQNLCLMGTRNQGTVSDKYGYLKGKIESLKEITPMKQTRSIGNSRDIASTRRDYLDASKRMDRRSTIFPERRSNHRQNVRMNPSDVSSIRNDQRNVRGVDEQNIRGFKSSRINSRDSARETSRSREALPENRQRYFENRNLSDEKRFSSNNRQVTRSTSNIPSEVRNGRNGRIQRFGNDQRQRQNLRIVKREQLGRFSILRDANRLGENRRQTRISRYDINIERLNPLRNDDHKQIRDVPVSDISFRNLQDTRVHRFNNEKRTVSGRDLPENLSRVSRNYRENLKSSESRDNTVRKTVKSHEIPSLSLRKRVSKIDTSRTLENRRLSTENYSRMSKQSYDERIMRKVISRLTALHDITATSNGKTSNDRSISRIRDFTRQTNIRRDTRTKPYELRENLKGLRNIEANAERREASRSDQIRNRFISGDSRQVMRTSREKTRSTFDIDRRNYLNTFKADRSYARRDMIGETSRSERRNFADLNEQSRRFRNIRAEERSITEHLRRVSSRETRKFNEERTQSRGRVLSDNRLARDDLRDERRNVELHNRRERNFRLTLEGVNRMDSKRDVSRERISQSDRLPNHRNTREFVTYRDNRKTIEKMDNEQHILNRESSLQRNGRDSDRLLKNMRTLMPFSAKDSRRESDDASVTRFTLRMFNYYKENTPYHLPDGISRNQRLASRDIWQQRKLSSLNKMEKENNVEIAAVGPWFRTMHITMAVIVLGQLMLGTGENTKSRVFPFSYLAKLKSY
ncbi:hypothetical protein HHI36_015321 [Cryptolaemus montrouzieri]|uniref:Uncharacterized protein n=1 Tax=Cryptolaemus montrouzieri TaxID=559131 RepID=A0ABD2N634_9CUCU